MAGRIEDGVARPAQTQRLVVFLAILGLYLTLRGYHSLDGDQAYRLPLLLHRQDPAVYAADPFVRAFDAFNPHRGALVLLDAASRAVGMSAALLAMFVLTFALTCASIDRLARALWPRAGGWAGLCAVVLVLEAKAGNIGTNQLFEAMVLDRLVALALFWFALADTVDGEERSPWRAPGAMLLATWVHPSFGLQLSALLAVGWGVWACVPARSGVSRKEALTRALGLAAATIPGLVCNLRGSQNLLGDMPPERFWRIAVEIQSPQHMLPHLWRMPQWLAFGAYLVLAALALGERMRSSPQPGRSAPGRFAGFRLGTLLLIALGGLAAAWVGIEVAGNVRITIFQPFRIATVVRGVALLFIAGRVVLLFNGEGWLGKVRAVVLAAAFAGDWLLVVATVAELAAAAAGWFRTLPRRELVITSVYVLVLARGFWFLAHHDTERGQIPLGAAAGVGLAVAVLAARRAGDGRAWLERASARLERRAIVIAVAAWLIPGAALVAGCAAVLDPGLGQSRVVNRLIDRCRFFEVPIDDVERLAVWCREHTPGDACFIGPPGPKTFRLWSRRSLAFNRAGSPYHAAGLEDWFRRFQDHVDDHTEPELFAGEYTRGRHEMESRYQARSDVWRAALAARQGAHYVIAAAPGVGGAGSSALRLLHREGRYAVYEPVSPTIAQRQR